MAEADSQRIRITLRWIKILDNLEPFFDDEGEFQFTAKISSAGTTTEARFPEQGFYSISDRPGWNFVELNRVIFDGEAGVDLTIEIEGEELDNVSANDQLDTYRRTFEGAAEDWYGVYKPHDEGEQVADDPEALSNWQLCYVIERA